MHYILLIIGIVLGSYGLYRFFLSANWVQIKSLFLVVFVVAMAAAVFFMAIYGRLLGAIGFLVALAPILLSLWSMTSRREDAPLVEEAVPSQIMGRREAYEILGLEEYASDEEIRTAHRKLIRKLHPDQDGSGWLAAKINRARDILLSK